MSPVPLLATHRVLLLGHLLDWTWLQELPVNPLLVLPIYTHPPTRHQPRGLPKQGLALATGMEMSKEKVPPVLVGSLGSLRGMASDYVGRFNQCETGGNFADSGLRRLSICFLCTACPLVLQAPRYPET